MMVGSGEAMDPLGLIIITECRTEYDPDSLRQILRQSRHTRIFLNGRERRESDQGRMIVIVQPDLRREVKLDMQTHTFTVRPIFELATAEEKQQWQKQGANYTRQHVLPDEKLITLDVFIHTERTEETAEFFGFPAQRYVTHRNDVYPSSVGKGQESVTDGWYLDFRHPAMPEPSRNRSIHIGTIGTEQPVIHRSGEPAYSGLPAKVVTTTRQIYRSPSGSQERNSKETIEIIGLTECSLDPALFEIPKDFRERNVFPSRWDDYASRFQMVLRRMRAA